MNMKDKKVIFMGTPEFSLNVLRELIENTNVIMVVTQSDKKVGRHQVLEQSPVKILALENGIEVFQPIKIREDYEKVVNANADIIITCAYGQIIPKAILDSPKLGCINVHASLLPKLRGGAPIHKAIINGEEKTGITIMYMDVKMDNGDIISQEEIEIQENDNLKTLSDKLSELGAKLLMETLPSIFSNTNKRIKQDETKVTFAYNITREEEHINFNKNAKEVYNHIRGLYPLPTAYAILDDDIVKILESKISNDINGNVGEITKVNKEGITVKCLDKSIIITKLKPSGKKEMNVKDFLNGYKGELLGKKFL